MPYHRTSIGPREKAMGLMLGKGSIDLENDVHKHSAECEKEKPCEEIDAHQVSWSFDIHDPHESTWYHGAHPDEESHDESVDPLCSRNECFGEFQKNREENSGDEDEYIAADHRVIFRKIFWDEIFVVLEYGDESFFAEHFVYKKIGDESCGHVCEDCENERGDVEHGED